MVAASTGEYHIVTCILAGDHCVNTAATRTSRAIRAYLFAAAVIPNPECPWCNWQYVRGVGKEEGRWWCGFWVEASLGGVKALLTLDTCKLERRGS